MMHELRRADQVLGAVGSREEEVLQGLHEER